ncbi:hypothetical protein Nepgr_027601 [Nepenthes gracilis]|uniref:Uncharacterized protein n=1 Tax=Nepenthes gracilis TaxID=150966 RepID=A0AAD3T946_NEPGR|nr:hypothetical protein Nepgr_027601 [Nepenthes gracilis]
MLHRHEQKGNGGSGGRVCKGQTEPKGLVKVELVAKDLDLSLLPSGMNNVALMSCVMPRFLVARTPFCGRFLAAVAVATVAVLRLSMDKRLQRHGRVFTIYSGQNFGSDQ